MVGELSFCCSLSTWRCLSSVSQEHYFKDKYLFYRFSGDEDGATIRPGSVEQGECEEQLSEVIMMLAQVGPDAMLRMILRKPYVVFSIAVQCERRMRVRVVILDLMNERSMIWRSSMTSCYTSKLCRIYRRWSNVNSPVSLFSKRIPSKTRSVRPTSTCAAFSSDLIGISRLVFSQGDEGKSWYIILKGSVQCIIYSKGVVETLHEGDDFGKLSLVNNSPRSDFILVESGWRSSVSCFEH